MEPLPVHMILTATWLHRCIMLLACNRRSQILVRISWSEPEGQNRRVRISPASLDSLDRWPLHCMLAIIFGHPFYFSMPMGTAMRQSIILDEVKRSHDQSIIFDEVNKSYGPIRHGHYCHSHSCILAVCSQRKTTRCCPFHGGR